MNHPLGIDLAPLRDAFFDEAADNLDRFEQLLLALDPTAPADDTLHALFRCVHSVKGGAAAFGLADAARFTHRIEAPLDRWRRREQPPSAAAVDTLLAAGDALRALLGAHRAGRPAPALDALADRLEALADPAASHATLPATPHATSPAAPPAASPTPSPAGSAAAADAAPAGAAGAPRRLELRLGPPDDPAAATGLVELFADIAELGRIEPLGDGSAPDGVRRFAVSTGCDDAELLELFGLHADASRLSLGPLPDTAPPPAFAPAFAPPSTPPAAAPAPAPAPASANASAHASAPAPPPAAAPAGSAAAATLRVPVDKVDLLLDQVGELVIAQSMLLQQCAALEPAAQQRLEPALAALQRQLRELQDTVLAVRMVPMGAVFARFVRLARELAAQLGKRVELVLEGEATELDKGMVERIVDPLTHLVRNALDHGIEAPAERRARGKPDAGRLVIAAAQKGASVLITVRDDGAGLSRARLLAKARERGLHAPDTLADDQVWALIFAPGFSTATAVTEVSGRGVGMDVVARNVASIGGTVEIDAAEGCGLTVRVRLPLTLAILDALLVRVAGECFVLPLQAVVESFRPEDAAPACIGGRRLVRLRDALLPVLPLQPLLRVPALPDPAPRRVLVAVEAEGARAALEVDELIGQQQVVVKNLLANCGPVEHVSAATVLGDGRVALILDIGSLVRHARRA